MAERNDSSGPEVRSTGVFTPTRVLAEKYRLGRMLGAGGMGAVYEAEHQELGSRVAVKLLSEAKITDPVALARFRREARALGAVRHENVVTVMDTGTDEGVPFLVMELLEGESLDGMLRRELALAPSLACWIASQILAGLSAAHSVGVIHRDLKPGNVFVTQASTGGDPRVKILDFGISKLGGATSTLNVTADGALLGTPNFMAPEQVRATAPLDARADIYAAGILLYRMLCGRLPYVGQSPEEVYRRILEARAVPPRQHRPEISSELEAVILRAMHPDRERRFEDAESFAAALGEVMSIEAPGFGGRATPPESVPVHRPPPTEDLGHAASQVTPESASGTGPAPRDPSEVTADAPSGEPSMPSTVAANPTSLRARETDAKAPRRRWPLWVALVALAAAAGALGVYAASGAPAGGAAADDPLRFGIIRHESPQAIIREMHPLTEYLAGELDRPVELVIVDNYEDVADELFAGNVDLGALSAYSYVRAERREAGLRLLATPVTPAGTSYEGYILARAGEGIDELSDLTGKVFCYVSENSSSGYLYPRALFRRAGMDPDSAFRATRFTTDHDASIRALDDGACDGAAVYDNAWHEAREQGISPTRFTVVAKTERIPWDAYTVTEELDDETADALAEALRRLGAGSDLAEQVLLDSDAPFVGFQPGNDELYDPVRRIEKYLRQDKAGD